MKKVFSLVALLLLLVLFAFPALPAYAATSDVSLAWDTPIAGTPLAADEAYRVYWGQASGVYSHNAPAGQAQTYTVTGLADGTWYFAVTTYNAAGLESVKSNEVSALLKTIIYPPKGTRVTTVTIRNQ